MPEAPKWGPGGPGYVRRPDSGTAQRDPAADRGAPVREGASRTGELIGITWDWSGIDLSVMGGTGGRDGVRRALSRFKANLPVIVWDAAKLEGSTFTLPEVQTLLDGVTVDGKRIEEQDLVLALRDAYNELYRRVAAGTFVPDKRTSDALHGLVARHEAIESDIFRGEGRVGGGDVRLSTGGGGGVVDGRAHGEGGALLIQAFADLIDYIAGYQDRRAGALVYAAAATRHQFYFDGNKRTAKLMASGILMSAGHDAISVPYVRLHEQNMALDRMFETDDATAYMRLLADCAR